MTEVERDKVIEAKVEEYRKELEDKDAEELLGRENLDLWRDGEIQRRIKKLEEELHEQDDAELLGEEWLEDLCDKEIEQRVELYEAALNDQDDDQLWTLFVEPDAEGRYLVKRKDGPGVMPEGSFTILVSGRGQPEVPAESLSYAELLRWQVRLLDGGFDVGEPDYRN
jgi:hypothetical protein